MSANTQQIVEQMLNLSLQHHMAKDQEINGLLNQVTELQKRLAVYEPSSVPEPPKLDSSKL